MALKTSYALQNYILKGARKSMEKSDKADNIYLEFPRGILLKW